jgi:Tol biopolymer transport system component
MLAGPRAFSGETAADGLSAILKDDPKKSSSLQIKVAPRLEEVVLRCIEKHPEERFQSASELGRRITDLVWGAKAGELLATRSDTEGKPSIWVIPLVGEAQPRKLIDSAAYPAVSPNGDMIAFLKDLYSPGGEVWVSKINGEAARMLISKSAGQAFSSPAWSPDGRWLAYERVDTARDRTSIEILNALGGAAKTILSESELPGSTLISQLHHPLRFSAEGRLLFLAKQPLDFLSSPVSLWQITINARGVAAENPRKLAHWANLSSASMSISADGKRLAILKRHLYSAVWLAQLDNKNAALRSPHRWMSDTRASFPTSWTLDSRELLFGSVQSGTPKIYRQTPETAVGERITTGSGSELGPRMTPGRLFHSLCGIRGL